MMNCSRCWGSVALSRFGRKFSKSSHEFVRVSRLALADLSPMQRRALSLAFYRRMGVMRLAPQLPAPCARRKVTPSVSWRIQCAISGLIADIIVNAVAISGITAAIRPIFLIAWPREVRTLNSIRKISLARS